MNKIIAAFAMALALTAAVSSYSSNVQADLQNNLIRLHIIADSDSEADQSVKLKVRDAILTEIGGKLKNRSLEACRDSVTSSLGEIEKIADRVLVENGFTYSSRAYFGKFAFPQKSYASFTLPAGEYWGVRVVLGSGKGKNWWCVLYPPLCFTENGGETNGNALHDAVGDDAYDVITPDEGAVTVKFRIVEIAQEIKQRVLR